MGTRWQRAAVARGATPRKCCELLVFGSALLLGACSSRSDGFAGAATLAAVEAPLAFTVHDAQATHRLATSLMESKEAAPGNQFVVLDVSVMNRSADPQVLPEGKLVAMSESGLQTFDTPETLFGDDYLSMQVLSPEQRVRGKIAYEVPQHLPGVLYWSPGSGSKRILLNVNAPQEPPRTLADAGFDDAVQPTIVSTPDIARHALVPRTAAGLSELKRTHEPPSSTLASPVAALTQTTHTPRATAAVEIPASARQRASTVPTPTQARAVALSTSSTRTPRMAANATPSATTGQGVRRVPAPTLASAGAAATLHVIAAEGARVAASVPESMPALPRNVAKITAPRSADRRVAMSAPTLPRSPGPEGDTEEIRQLACQGLVARDEPWEKSNNLGFFSASCRDYPLPSRWQPQRAQRSIFARMSAALAGNARTAMAGHAPACDTSSHAARLVCRDAVLSAMDIQLDRSVQRAGGYANPIALLREQEQWNVRIRNACKTVACLQQAYRRQQARMDALIPPSR